MSGVAKGVKKVFKAVGKLVKKIWKPLVIAAAIYFTGGLALSAFGPTQAFAASLPGFGISSTGVATGVFSKAAVAMGMQGGLVAGANAGVTAASTGVGIAAGGAGAGAGATAAGVMGPAAGATTAAEAAAIMGGTAAAGGGGLAAAAGMSFTDKLLLASLGSKAVGAFLAPSMSEQYEEAKRWRGAYYGTYANGTSDPAPPAQPATAGTQAISGAAAPVSNRPEPVAQVTPPQRELMATQPSQAPQPMPEVGGAYGAQAPVDNAPIEQRQLMAPGVRYV